MIHERRNPSTQWTISLTNLVTATLDVHIAFFPALFIKRFRCQSLLNSQNRIWISLVKCVYACSLLPSSSNNNFIQVCECRFFCCCYFCTHYNMHHDDLHFTPAGQPRKIIPFLVVVLFVHKDVILTTCV